MSAAAAILLATLCGGLAGWCSVNIWPARRIARSEAIVLRVLAGAALPNILLVLAEVIR